jgi:hypothetical protein
MEKKTAVEWLEMQIVKLEKDYAIPHKIYMLCEQAKEMEKEQIINAVYDGMGTNFDPNMGRARQYYNQKYKQD